MSLPFVSEAVHSVLNWLLWPFRFIRQKRAEAALGVLGALDRVRGAFHTARKQGLLLYRTTEVGRGSLTEYQQRTEEGRVEHQRELARVREAMEGLKDAQASAVALWGDAARDVLKGVHDQVDAYEKIAALFWPKVVYKAKVMDRRRDPDYRDWGNLEDLTALQSVVWGHPGDQTGTAFNGAVRRAEAWYGRHAGRRLRRAQSGPKGG